MCWQLDCPQMCTFVACTGQKKERNGPPLKKEMKSKRSRKIVDSIKKVVVNSIIKCGWSPQTLEEEEEERGGNDRQKKNGNSKQQQKTTTAVIAAAAAFAASNNNRRTPTTQTQTGQAAVCTKEEEGRK